MFFMPCEGILTLIEMISEMAVFNPTLSGQKDCEGIFMGPVGLVVIPKDARNHTFRPQTTNIGKNTSTVVPGGTCSVSRASMAGSGSS